MSDKLTFQAATKICEDFATKYQLKFKTDAFVGFGRPCVGFLKDDFWVTFNPGRFLQGDPYYEEIEVAKFDPSHVQGQAIISHQPRQGVPDAYHKDDFFCVLKNGEMNIGRSEEEVEHGTQEELEEAVRQLAVWVHHLEDLPRPIKVLKYATDASGTMLMIGHPRYSHCIVMQPVNNGTVGDDLEFFDELQAEFPDAPVIGGPK